MLININKNDFSIPFPQANDVYKIIKYVDEQAFNYYKEYLKHVSLNLVKRQKDYYKTAASYLGLIKNGEVSKIGILIFSMEKDIMFHLIVKLILEKEIFNNYYRNRNKSDTLNYLIQNHNLNEVTANRRMNTLEKWIQWCDVIIKDNNIKVDFNEY